MDSSNPVQSFRTLQTSLVEDVVFRQRTPLKATVRVASIWSVAPTFQGSESPAIRSMLHTLPQFQVTQTPPTDVPDQQIQSDRQSCLVRIYPAGVSGSLIPLTFRRMTMGRDQGCTIEVNDDFMSRTHAILELTDQGFKKKGG